MGFMTVQPFASSWRTPFIVSSTQRRLRRQRRWRRLSLSRRRVCGGCISGGNAFQLREVALQRGGLRDCRLDRLPLLLPSLCAVLCCEKVSGSAQRRRTDDGRYFWRTTPPQ